MITIKSFQPAKAVLEVQEGRRTSVGENAKQVVASVEEVARVSKQMFVILEGPDCSGKSTLALDLAEYFKVPLEKNLRIKDPGEVIKTIANNLVFQHPRKTGVGVLKDRWQYPSDIIYEQLHGRADSRLIAWEPTLLRELNASNVLFLYVTASPKALTSRYDKRGDEHVDGEQIVKAAALYDKFFANSKSLPYKTIDTTSKTPQQAFQAAVRAILDYYKEDAE